MPTLPILTTLHRAEFPDGYATVLVLIENAGGAPRHTHPGLEVTYILEGEAKLSVFRPETSLTGVRRHP
jgi:quercetin dioxygenase-like cupin family protein